MHGADNKKILLIGGVVAGSLIILAARFLIGGGFQKSTNERESLLKEALKKAQADATASYQEYQATKKETDESLAELRAKIEAESNKEEPTPSDETIKNLGEKLKTAQTEQEKKQ